VSWAYTDKIVTDGSCCKLSRFAVCLNSSIALQEAQLMLTNPRDAVRG